jgi:hypothetical protein
MGFILLKTDPAGKQLPGKFPRIIGGTAGDACGANRGTYLAPQPPYRLVERIVALSDADSWGEAKREWVLSGVFFAESPGVCLCRHYPIIEHCVIRNRKNGNVAIVGNYCVRRFLGLPSDRIFAGLRRIAKDQGAPLGEAAVEYARTMGWINDWEYRFYLGVPRGCALSPKQRAQRVEINGRVLDRARTQAADEEEGRHA